MKVEATKIPGVKLIWPGRHDDARGFLFESFRRATYAAAGVELEVQHMYLSRSKRAVLRGLHYQYPKAQGKLITVLEGEIFDVVVDIRRGSGEFGDWMGSTLIAGDCSQIWVPEGCAHGFLVLSDHATVHYACSAPYSPEAEHTLQWNDPQVGIDWPFEPKIISGKDRVGKKLSELESAGLLPSL